MPHRAPSDGPPGPSSALDALIAPSARADFARAYGRAPFVQHGPLDRLPAELSAMAERTAGALATEARHCRAWYRKLDGRHGSMAIGAADVPGAHEAGMTLYLQDLASLRRVAGDLARELGLPRGTGSVFASRPGGHFTRGHFDHADAFTVQIAGRKRWRVAENAHVRLPTVNWMTGDDVDPELLFYADTPLPDAMPEAAAVFDLAPGSVLYVPRGHWHATETLEDSLSVDLSAGAVPWVDLVLPAIRACLVRHERWRETSAGAWGDPALRPAARRRLGELLEALAADLAPLTAEAVLPSREAPSSYERNPLAAAAFAGDGAVRIVRQDRLAPAVFRLDGLDPPLAGAIRWILARPSAFTIAELAGAVVGLDLEDAEELVGRLHECGLLVSGGPGGDVDGAG